MAICSVSLIPRRCGVPQSTSHSSGFRGALHLALFEQPAKDDFFSSLLDFIQWKETRDGIDSEAI
jgi:hypothetical protein